MILARFLCVIYNFILCIVVYIVEEKCRRKQTEVTKVGRQVRNWSQKDGKCGKYGTGSVSSEMRGTCM